MPRPNILLITADDMAGATPAFMGGDGDVTPGIDGLARGGIAFRRAHVPIAVCQPSRSALMTGRRPHRNGAEGFERIRDRVPLLTDVLREVGYRCGILGKVEHLQPEWRFGWDHVRQRDELGLGRDPRRYAREAESFVAAARAEEQPWLLMANAHDPHRPFHDSEDERQRFPAEQLAEVPEPSRVYSVSEVSVPGFLPDLPAVREEVAQYQSSARRCDDVVRALLDVVRDAGAEEHTIVVFFSDNGMAFPFAKANCYLQSTLTPLVIRWPGAVEPGIVDRTHFVSTLDLFPTFCAAAGATAPDDLDGASLLSLLEGGSEQDRDAIVTSFHETAAKGRYEMRAIQTAEHGYIWNSWSNGDRAYRAENMMGLSWPAMLDAAAGDEALEARTRFYVTRAPDELYDLSADPHCLVNLAGDPEHAPDLETLRARLLEHLSASEDPLADTFAAHTEVSA